MKRVVPQLAATGPTQNSRMSVFPSWAVFLEALTTFTIPPELLKTQKIE